MSGLRIRHCSVTFVVAHPWAVPAIDWAAAADQVIQNVAGHLATAVDAARAEHPLAIGEISLDASIRLSHRASPFETARCFTDAVARAAAAAWTSEVTRTVETASAIALAEEASTPRRSSEGDIRIGRRWRILELTSAPIVVPPPDTAPALRQRRRQDVRARGGAMEPKEMLAGEPWPGASERSPRKSPSPETAEGSAGGADVSSLPAEADDPDDRRDHRTAPTEIEQMAAAQEQVQPARGDVAGAPSVVKGRTAAPDAPVDERTGFDPEPETHSVRGRQFEAASQDDQRSNEAAVGRSRPRVLHGELWVPSVLPFLMLWPLEDFGLLDSIADAFDEDDLLDLMPVMAYALAQKALPPREAGWLRDPAYDMTAAAFAGLHEPPDGYALDALARTAHRWAPALHEAVTIAVLAVRDPTEPLIAVPRSESTLAVATTTACLPLTWEASVERTRDLWVAAGRPKLHVHDVDGFHLLEALTSLEGAARSVSDDEPGVVGLYTTVRELDGRPCAPRTPCALSEAVFAHLAACALAELGARLWGSSRATDAGLVFEWLSDLCAEVVLDHGRLSVALPFGERSNSLQAAMRRNVVLPPWLQ